MGLSLKDSAPGFDPSLVPDYDEDDDVSFAEDEQY
jgi:DNA-directed RNA polymerase subunit alpha